VTEQTTNRIQVLWANPDFRSAVKEFLATEKESLLEQLRAAVRKGGAVDSALIEGKMKALDDLPLAFDRVCADYVPPQREL